MYLEKTAAAISSLQKIHKKNNSPQSPAMLQSSPNASPIPQNNFEKSVKSRSMQLHKRNASIGAPTNYKHEFYDSGEMLGVQETMKHISHNLYECKQVQPASSKRCDIDQTISCYSSNENHRYQNYFRDVDKREQTAYRAHNDTLDEPTVFPIRRSSSFSNRNIANIMPIKSTTPKANKKHINCSISGNSSLQKSASSSSFKKLAATTLCIQHYQAMEPEYFILNGNDNLRTCDEFQFSSDESHDINSPSSKTGKHQDDRQKSEPPISHTRYNKAFLMRMEQNRQINSDNKGGIACPNTPELSRRAPRTFRDPTSMPRDSSLSRLKKGLPNLQATKKTLTQVASKDSSSSSTCSAKQRVLPKYMDISKYKPVQGQSYLKRDESKSTLVSRNEIRKSPSATGLSKNDPLRSSGRIKSAGAKPSTPHLKGNVLSC